MLLHPLVLDAREARFREALARVLFDELGGVIGEGGVLGGEVGKPPAVADV